MKIVSANYNELEEETKHKIAILLDRVWPADEGVSILNTQSHDKNLNVKSFYIEIENKVVCYAGVARKAIEHNDNSYNIAGLTSVATHPHYQHQGLATLVVSAASLWIQKGKGIDFAVFTCQPSLVDFYLKTGNWAVANSILLKGNSSKDSITSQSINAKVLVQLISAKAISHEEEICNGTINLGLTKGQFI